jgi:hypothetical protein
MGPMGAMGIAGATGMTGPAGATGPAGPLGPQGVAGAQGPGGAIVGEAAAQFAGFTTATFAGAGTGREAMHARCAAAFAGSHLCHASEYYLSNSATVPPAAGAWIDSSAFTVESGSDTEVSNFAGDIRLGRYLGGNTLNCGGWTANGNVGYVMDVSGVTQAQCSTSHALACCSTPYAERFRGFSAAVTGTRAGGRAEMNQLCGVEFPGSHICHHAEYGRTNNATTIPAAGAWIDSSSHLRTQGDVFAINYVASASMGRYVGGNTLNCGAWTTNGNVGYTLTTNGLAQAQCNTAHPIACCD